MPQFRPRHIYERGCAYKIGKYEICREPLTSKRIWRVWEGHTPIDGFKTLRDAVAAVNKWYEQYELDQIS